METQSPDTLPGGQLEASPEFANAVMGVSAALIAVLDREGRIVRFNRACEQATGYRFEEVRGSTFFSLLRPEDVGRLREEFEKMVAGDSPTYRVNEWLGRHGARRLISWSNSVLRDADGTVRYVVATGIDITEQRQVTDELARLRERDRRRAEELLVALAQLQAIIDSMSQALLIADLRGRIISMNPAALELHGVSRYESRYAHPEDYSELFEAFDPEGRPLPLEQWPVVRAMHGESVRDLEMHVLVRATGKTFTGLYSATPVRDEHGKPILAIVTIQDITGIKQAEEKLRASEARFRTLADNAPDLIVRFDRELRYDYANEAVTKTLGLPVEQLIGKTGRDIVGTGEPVVSWERSMRRVFETGQPQVLEFEFEGPLGRRFYETRMVAERTDGRINRVLAIGRDITDRRRTEEERERLLSEVGQLADRLERLQATTEALSAAATSREVAHIVLHEGARAAPPVRSAVLVANTPGAPRDEMQMLDHLGVWPEESKRRWFHFRLEQLEPELRAALLAGEPIWIEDRDELAKTYPGVAAVELAPNMQALVLLPVATEGRLVGAAGFSYGAPRRFDSGERDFLLTLARLSAQALVRTHLYESEQHLRAEAEREALLRERLVAVLGHDLRQPMSVISASIGSVLRRPEGLSERSAGQLQRAVRAVGNMDVLIRTLLDYSRLRAGKSLQLVLTEGDLGDWAEGVLTGLRASNADRRLELDRRGDLRGEWDRARLEQVFGNLVGNALRYGDPKAPVHIEARDEGALVALEVTNRVPPIAAEVQAHIFEPLRHARGEHAGSRGGLGLGLYIAREIARAHGGDVELRSSAEQGTVFTVRLPRRPAGKR